MAGVARRAVGALLCMTACGRSPAALPSASHAPTQLREPSAIAQSAPAQAGSTRPPSARESLAIARLMRDAERVRRLRFKRPVPVLVQDRAAIIDYARSRLDGDELRRARITYTALGLLPHDIALAELLLRLLGEQVIGYYDDRNGRLIVRDEVMRAFERERALSARALAEARMTLVHELVHALQDQHLQLGRLLHQPRDTDAANAFKALYEGDAMLAMTAFARVETSDGSSDSTPPSLEGAAQQALATGELAQAPAIVRTPLLFAYVQGLVFATHLFAQGGWERIDRGYQRPPTSTEQVLHPGSGARLQRVQLPRLLDGGPLLDGQHRLLHEDTLGELELSVYFSRGLGDAAARGAAAGWAGDRLYLYEAAQAATIAVWITSWDSVTDAREAAAAAERVQAAEGRSTRSWVERAGRHVLIVRHATPEQHARVHARFVAWARH